MILSSLVGHIHGLPLLDALSASCFIWQTLVCLMVALLTGAACDRHDQAVKWGYDGPGAPEHWASLSEEYTTCANGRRQSPVDWYVVREPMSISPEQVKRLLALGGGANNRPVQPTGNRVITTR